MQQSAPLSQVKCYQIKSVKEIAYYWQTFLVLLSRQAAHYPHYTDCNLHMLSRWIADFPQTQDKVSPPQHQHAIQTSYLQTQNSHLQYQQFCIYLAGKSKRRRWMVKWVLIVASHECQVNPVVKNECVVTPGISPSHCTQTLGFFTSLFEGIMPTIKCFERTADCWCSRPDHQDRAWAWVWFYIVEWL